MKRVVLKSLAALGAAVLLEAGAAGPVVQTVDVTGHRTRFDGPGPAAVRYLLVDPANADPAVNGFAPIATRAVLMLLTGGDGRLGFGAGTTNLASPNFVVRTRMHFAAEGFVVAVVDAANDFIAHQHPDVRGDAGYNHGAGLKGHRLPGELYGAQHAQDLAAVMADLRGAKKVQVLQFEGGSAPLSSPCDPLDAHGFFGVEQAVIDAIARWIVKNDN